jgi:hypothetical protein
VKSVSVTWCGSCGQVTPCAFAVACAVPITGLRGPFVRRQHYDQMRNSRLGALCRARSLGLPVVLPAAIYADPHPGWPPRKWQNRKSAARPTERTPQ